MFKAFPIKYNIILQYYFNNNTVLLYTIKTYLYSINSIDEEIQKVLCDSV